MARLAFPPFLRVFKDNGDVCTDATATWYDAGTTTLVDSYPTAADADAGTNPNTNPVTANSLGIFPAMWLEDASEYKIVLAGTGVTTKTVDDVYSTASLDQLSGDRRYLGLAGGAAYNTTGSANAYVVSTGLSTSSLSTYETLLIKPNFTNTGAATLNVDSIGAKNIFLNGAALASGALVSGQIYELSYDGTQFQIIGGGAQPLDATLTALAALTGAGFIRASGTDTFSMIGGYTYGSRQIFTSSTTWNRPAGCRAVLVRLVGGGGGGSSVTANTSEVNVGAGASAGTYAEKFITSPGSSETVTIGAGGAAESNGGASSFGSHVSCPGGLGTTGESGSGTSIQRSGSGAARPGVATGADFYVIGQGGGIGIRLSGTIGISGRGGSSVIGAGGSEVVENTAGIGGEGYGAGGSGGASNSTTPRAGGAGYAGLIIVEEFY